ncbi:MAG TPA: M20/M25/M40 family metallo-hydrolase [Verrucomicrobiae bacterium]|nr:M20/M25/M40 family metallo-hydrolase [Verrucomicrobiae bacterium]
MTSSQEAETLDRILADLVAFKTVSGQYEAALGCLDYAEAYLTRCGMHIRRKEYDGFPALVATSRSTKRPKVLLQAHIDVVSAPDSCYQMQEKDGRLFGRGVFDMKFAAAIFLKLAGELQDRLTDYDFGIMLTSDEEIGGLHGVKMLLDDGYGADVCVLPDAGKGWKIETSHKGCWIGRAYAKGLAAHGSKPWDGDNAIDRLIDALCEIRELFKDQDEDSDTLSVNQIVGGAVVNQVADKAEAVMDLRFLDDESFARLQREMNEIAKRHKVSLETVRHITVSQTNVDHPLVQPFLAIAERLHGEPLKRVRSLGMSDAHYFTKQGTPVILVRPDGGGSHGDKEWIDKTDLGVYFELVKAYVEEVSARASSDR